MTTTINASTSSGLVVTPDNSGNVLLQYNGVAAPAFSAYLTADQSITSNVYTKVAFDAELFDTNNNFASSRFTPTVAGYYQINTGVFFTGTGGSVTRGVVKFYKTGNPYKFGNYIPAYASTTAVGVCSSLIYLNGSTDYVEVYVYVEGTSPSFVGGADGQATWFDGCLLRGA